MKALLSIISRQSYEGENTGAVELVTDGSFWCEDGAYHIRYTETEMSGVPGAVTEMIVYSDDLVSVTRTGPASSQLIFEKGVRHNCPYDLGLGEMNVAVSQVEIDTDISPAGGHVDLNYSIEINNIIVGENEFRIKIKEAVPDEEPRK